ncbi:MAG: response regulator transcription factor [Candidatus Pseudobacter hemicellulosilyticus]|uniref:Response regulator transcription factor n=1 Tax=Candidatus Pseudobacter hemicellulosilyticus TaxID=3121375 RepID=A0AAJ5WWE3_9BACT|nr:MAG: response regulator transcription factor [Pseudobacter sp.]
MNNTRILYVEDEQFLGKIVKESLESRGFTVVMESDGLQVMDAFRQLHPDVCVLDVMLPGKDGFTLAEEIRQLDATVPIIFLTARTQTEDLVKGFATGGNDYIRKPFSMEELIVRIANVLRYRPEGSGSREEWKIGRYLFQVSRQTLSLEGEERKLSFRETELLKLLYRNREKIIDRKEVLNLLWGNDSVFNSRNLDVYITKLRSYLRHDDALAIITIKGIGYRFVMEK